MKKDALIAILISITLGALAQIILKIGMTQYGQIGFGTGMILAVFHPLVFIGLTLYFISAMFWIIALSKTDVSYAYPFASLGYVIVALISWLFLNEQIKTLRIIGIAVIILGVYIVGKSTPGKTNKTKKQSKQ